MLEVLNLLFSDLVLVIAVDFFGDAKLSHIRQIGKLLTLTRLLLCLHQILFDMLLRSILHLLSIRLALHDLGNALRGVLPHTLDVVGEVVEPEGAQFLEN